MENELHSSIVRVLDQAGGIWRTNFLGRTDQAADLLFALAQDMKVGVDVRIQAAEVLGELDRADQAADVLLSLVQDKEVDAVVRVRAAGALGRLGRADLLFALAQGPLEELGCVDQVADLLLALARDTLVWAGMRMWAVESLEKLDRADLLLALAQDAEVLTSVRVRAAKALGKLGHADQAADLLFVLAQDMEVWVGVCVLAVVALGKLGRADLLLNLTQDKAVDIDVRVWAAEALGKLGYADQVTETLFAIASSARYDAWWPVWGSLRRSSDSQWPDQRMRAAEVLGELGRTDQAAEVLLAMTQDENVRVWVRMRAAKTLGELGHADQATDFLLTMAQNKEINAAVRMWAAWTLGELGRTDLLLALMQDQSEEELDRMSPWVSEVLKVLGYTEQAADVLVTMAWDEEAPVGMRVRAAEALGELGRADQAADILLSLMQDEKAKVEERVWAAKTLRNLGRAAATLPVLNRLQAQQADVEISVHVRDAAREALEHLSLYV